MELTYIQVFKQDHFISNLKFLFLFFIILTSPVYAYVGEVSFQSRQAQITRGNEKILTSVGTKVEMGDKIETLKGDVGIIFIDNTKASISEYSELIIDEFVYDNKTNKGKLNLKAKLGTLRYSSGLLAKNNKKGIKITTPTASVSVRGTDFDVKVAETGQSVFTLLPSIDATGNLYTGIIDVFTSTGMVTLDTAFEFTEVETAVSLPTPPKVNIIRQQNSKVVIKKDNNKKDKDDTKDKKESNEQVNVKEVIEENKGETIMEKAEEDAVVFELVEGKAVFIQKDSNNFIKLILNESSNASLNYENSSTSVEGNLNNGGSVNINIIQQ